MFDMAWGEIALIGLVAVLVLGPKELPNAMRTMAKFTRRMRSLSSELQGHINEVVREAELEEVRQSIQKISSTSVSDEVTKIVDPKGELRSVLNPDLAPPPAQTVEASAVVETPAPEPSPETPASPDKPAASS